MSDSVHLDPWPIQWLKDHQAEIKIGGALVKLTAYLTLAVPFLGRFRRVFELRNVFWLQGAICDLYDFPSWTSRKKEEAESEYRKRLLKGSPIKLLRLNYLFKLFLTGGSFLVYSPTLLVAKKYSGKLAMSLNEYANAESIYTAYHKSKWEEKDYFGVGSSLLDSVNIAMDFGMKEPFALYVATGLGSASFSLVAQAL